MPRVARSKPSNPNPQQQKATNAQSTIGQVIEAAEVVDIIMDPSHPEWSTDQRRLMGCVLARPLISQFGQPIDNLQWYQPLNTNFQQPPLLGEIVLLINAPSTSAQLKKEGSAKYYMTVVNVWNYVNHNALPASSYNINAPDENPTQNYRGFTGNSKGGYNDIPFGETFEEKNIPRIFPYEGDIIYEGRWGQSIRFGSTVSEAATGNSWSSDGEDGDPITVISNGHATEGSDSAYHLESVNGDASGIWMCDGQSIPIQVASENADSYAQSFAGAKEAERLAIAGADAPETNTDGGASSGGSAAADSNKGGHADHSSGGSGNNEDDGPAADTTVEPDEDIQEAVEELEDAGEFDAYRNGKFVEKIECVVIDGKIVNKAFADKILSVKQAAQKDGVNIKLNSGFRPMEAASGQGWSTSGQLTLRRKHAGTQVGGTKSGLSAAAGTYEDGFAAQKRQGGYFKPLTAGPGYSNHQNGKAFDLQTGMGRNLTPYKNTTKTYRWMVANMHKFGFIRTVSKERWHWEYAPGKGMFSRVPRDHGTWDNLV
jgi:hypothetical protein